MPGESQFVWIYILQIWSPLPIQERNYGTIGFVNVHILNRRLIERGENREMVKKWQDIAY